MLFKVTGLSLSTLCVAFSLGKTDGQVMVIREDSDVICYQWSAGTTQWVKVGDVVGSAAESATGGNRVLFEGKVSKL